MSALRDCRHRRRRGVGARTHAQPHIRRAARAGAATIALAAALTGCSRGASSPSSTAQADVAVTPLVAPSCSGRFVGHDLPHRTTSRGQATSVVDGTGAGVAAGDLNGDGWDDVVLANLDGDVSILWNRRNLNFDRSVLTTGHYRQVLIVDVDSDGRNDIILTTGVGPPSVYLNRPRTGAEPSFERSQLDGVRSFTYSLGVGDLHGRGALDYVTGAYNAELTVNRDPRALAGVDVGVNLQSRAGAAYLTTQLSDNAQALVTMIADLDGDHAPDVLVGNDLSTRDMTWLNHAGALARAEPFETTTLSTMSLDLADYDGDGRTDLFATDMRPLPGEPTGAWERIFDQIRAASVDDVQRPHNVLQHALSGGPEDTRFAEVSDVAGVSATGWSWSGLFGDLNNDSRPDIYVVNGMESGTLLAEQPDHRLVEANQAFVNSGDGRFAPAPQWNLAETAGGRGMVIDDLNHDGTLDIVVNNLNDPARLLENQVCGGRAVEVALSWPGSHNTQAVNAEVTVRGRRGGRGQERQVLAGRGYLSGGPTAVHAGVGDQAGPFDVDVRWPDGKVTTTTRVAAGSLVTIARTTPASSSSSS